MILLSSLRANGTTWTNRYSLNSWSSDVNIFLMVEAEITALCNFLGLMQRTGRALSRSTQGFAYLQGMVLHITMENL